VLTVDTELRILKALMETFPKIRDPHELSYIDLLNYLCAAQRWEIEVRGIIELNSPKV
jgi:hypothetical protein